MIPLPLTGEQQASLNAALHSRHRRVRFGAQIMDMQERVLWDVSDMLIDGEVTQAAPDNGVHRALTMSLHDPRSEVRMDLDVATGQIVPPSSFLARATYGVWLPDLREWVDVPVHTGPVVSATRQGGTIDIEAQSMERQMMKSPPATLTLRKHWFCTRAIEIALESTGQEKFALLPSQARLQKDITIGPFEGSLTPWQAASRVARSLGLVIFADASGTVRTRKSGGRAVWTFTHEEIVERPTTAGDALEVINRVEVRGAKKGSTTISAHATLPASHALSEQSLARNGKPTRSTEWITDDSIQTKAQAKEVAQAQLDGHTKAVMEVQASVLVNPLLERHDTVQLPDAPMTKFLTGSIPLGLGAMSFNSHRLARFRRPRR